ncbi:hypothetical protein ACS0TY_007290 [Phlomoides rotata]
MLVVNGRWREDGGKMVIINVYAPCVISKKERLWDTIKLVIEQNKEARICVVGDFNSIRANDERIGRGEEIIRRDIRVFDDFIVTSGMIDLPLLGQKFTWYKPDGTCKSKLDQILNSIIDWGPKPFKYFNGWATHPGFKELCEQKWKSYTVEGWKSYTLKEKLKLLKSDLKTWSHETFGEMKKKMEDQKAIIDKLDRFDEVFGLEEEEIIERNRVEAELKRNLIWNESFIHQKTKIKWLKEGDMNSSFFHGWINRR